MTKTTEQLVAEIEARVRPTICPTHRFTGEGHEETLEGRISLVDFETLLRLYRASNQPAEALS